MRFAAILAAALLPLAGCAGMTEPADRVPSATPTSTATVIGDRQL